MSSVSKPRVRHNRHKQGLNLTLEKLSADFREEDKMSIRFSDNGCGIPREDWESIFEIFKTTTQNQGGAGIGLFTVKKRIEALTGEIKVVDPEYVEHGATFLITLPFNK